jgi:hypothetical protein
VTGTRSILAPEIERLLERLDAYDREFLASPPETRPLQLVFVDVDVIHTYIAGRRERLDELALWTNPLSLPENIPPSAPDRWRFSELDHDTLELTTAIGQAVARFLFGEFNEQLVLQDKRYFLTTEHERELQSVLQKVVSEVASPSARLQDQLRGHYLRLGTRDLDADDAQATVDEISELLGMTAGAVVRGREIRLRYTTSPANQQIRLPNGTAFAFSEEQLIDRARFARVRDAAFETHLQWLAETNPTTGRYVALKRAVFQRYIDDGPNRPALHFVQALAAHPASTELGLSDKHLQLHILRALREAADVVSLGRLAAVAHGLTTHHPLGSGRQWQICLITGSNRFAGILDALRRVRATEDLVASVRITHPLCFLRHPELYDPQGVKAVSRTELDSSGGEYALAKILGEPNGAVSVKEIEPRRFVESLTRTLKGVLIRLAGHDRSLKTLFQDTLPDTKGFECGRLQQFVRHFIARSFAETFVSLRELELGPGERSPAQPISIPVLDLRRSPTAVRIFSTIRRRWDRRPNAPTTDGRDAEPASLVSRRDIEQILNEDTTGYSALLCAALGYIARGRAWLQAAHAVTSTAFMLAEGRTDRSLYPHGNSALYLRSFVARLVFDPAARQGPGRLLPFDEAVRAWYEHQRATVEEALGLLDEWRSYEPRAAEQNVFGPDHPERFSAYALTKLRYEVEGFANLIFKQLWLVRFPRATPAGREIDRAAVDTLRGVLAQLSLPLTTWIQVDEVTRARRAASPNDPASVDKESLIAFLGSEIWKAALQGWLLMDYCLSRLEPSPPAGAREELAAHERLFADHLERYKDAMGDEISTVIRLVYETFAMRKLGIGQGDWGVTETDFGIRFAAIDELRFSFFLERWQAAAAEAAQRRRGP